ncbi:PREDICTED: CASP-like protein 1D1 [Tarenaya hassleriana]|uniref:CASP-like protein 1D1 n=1 Tax=Tarenaya hassleriana TaxID=28532 RepID=UPI00053C3859|nr:PREDICTED: CASP-like protein 1D1 [Tarenaya hassleriana]
MASTETKSSLEADQPRAGAAATARTCLKGQVGLRVILFAATLTSVVVMVTSKQTELVPVPGTRLRFPNPAKFTDSPALIYFVAALSVACFYSIVSTLASLSAISKPSCSSILFLYLAILDVMMLGIVASATGAGGGVAYIGLKGNKHVRWGKICNIYDKFSRHVGGSIAVSLFASVVLVLLSVASVVSLYKRIR